MRYWVAFGFTMVASVAFGQAGFWVRPGYTVTLAAQNLGECRFMAFDTNGNLYVSQPNAGKIITLKPSGSSYVLLATFTSSKSLVQCMDFNGGWLWYATSGAIYKARDTNGDGKADETITIKTGLPSGGGHWMRSLCVTTDAIYTSIGDSNNASDERATDRQKVWKYNRDGTGKTLWSSGIRNTEKLRMRPGTTELYGADNGSDNFGASFGETSSNQPITDTNPPCEFNHYVQGGFYGHPFLVGNRVPRIEYQGQSDLLSLAAATIKPAWSFGAHWAPLGWTFLKTSGLGGGFAKDALVACHGSWNSTVPVGYRVERVMFDRDLGVPFGSQPLVITLSSTGNVLARPTDVIEAPDGSVLFSDDWGQKIYRITKT
jgi:glucose/arabinose dehydrogenase